MPSVVTLKDLKAATTTVMETSEDNLAKALATISAGDTVSNVELLKYQIDLTTNSLTAMIASSVAKERGETLKAVAQKF